MNKAFFNLFIFFFSFNLSTTSAIDASIDYAVFDSHESPYVELYFQMLSKSLGFEVLADGHIRSTVKIIVSIKDSQGQFVIHDSLKLNSPLDKSVVPDFKHVSRYALKNGNYRIDVEIKDVLKVSKSEQASFNIEVAFDDEKVNQSMIQILSSYHADSSSSPFTKNGIYYEVLPYSFCNNLVDELNVYNEIYNTDKIINEDFITHVWISRKSKKEIILENLKRTKSTDVVIVLRTLNIEKLASGNYDIHVDVLDRNKNLISSQTTGFQRLKQRKAGEELVYEDIATAKLLPIWVDTMSAKSLRYSLKALFPILEFYDVERLNQALSNKKIDQQKHFLLNFWASQSKVNEIKAYSDYMNVAKAVDKTFYSGFGHGFETDRGVIFLRYGQPDNSISIDNEPGAFPYEIWKYNKINKTGQTNVKFIFYNKSLASNAFEILHSTAEGEYQNEKWEILLYSGAAADDLPANFIDAKNAGDGFLRRAREYFKGM